MTNPDSPNLCLDLTAVDKTVGLRAWLTYHRISEKELARRIGVTPSTISRFINGHRRSEDLKLRMQALGIPEELL